MSATASERWIARGWIVLALSSALHFLSDNEADNDLWMHLFSGRHILAHGAVPGVDDASYTAAGAPWVDHEWLAQVALAALFEIGGSPTLWAVKLAIGVLTAGLMWLLVRRAAAMPSARGAAMVLALATMARGYAVRPQVLSYLGLAALLAWLVLRGSRRVTWQTYLGLAGAFAVWANLHGAVIAGLAVLAIYAAVGGEGTPARAQRVAFLAAAVLGCCVNPYGPALFAYIAGELRVAHPISEWQAVDLFDTAHRPFAVSLVALVLTLPFARLLRRHGWWAVLVAGLAVMALRAQRHTPLFAICAAAPLADQLDGAFRWLSARVRLSAAATAGIAAGLCSLAAVQLASLAYALWHDRGALMFEAGEYPVGALRHVRQTAIRGNLAVPLDWGGYALFHAAPAVKVSLDGRFATVYPPRVVEDGFAFFRGDGDSRLLDAYPTDLALVPHDLRTAAHARPGWRVLYADDVATLYGRDGLPASGVHAAPRGRQRFP
ncbi:MAG: hypothetical protein AB7V27_10910 [Candidatus Binatia bacterium]